MAKSANRLGLSGFYAPPRLRATRPWKKMRIGLLGGSFNPAHKGHVHASRIAMTYLDLDAVWWLVSPGNPLKANVKTPDIDIRMQKARGLVRHPRIVISDIERQMGTKRSFDTVSALKRHFPNTEFVWLAGTDIAFEFHRWYRWQDLSALIPFAFVGRPTKSGLVRKNALHQTGGLRHFYPRTGIRPELRPGSVFWLYSEPLNPLSSTLLRQAGGDLL